MKLLFGIGLTLSGGATAKMAGISPDLGAFLMGALLADHPDSRVLSDKLWGVKEAFLVAFFLEIGLMGIPTSEEFFTALRLLALLPDAGPTLFLYCSSSSACAPVTDVGDCLFPHDQCQTARPAIYQPRRPKRGW